MSEAASQTQSGAVSWVDIEGTGGRTKVNSTPFNVLGHDELPENGTIVVQAKTRLSVNTYLITMQDKRAIHAERVEETLTQKILKGFFSKGDSGRDLVKYINEKIDNLTVQDSCFMGRDKPILKWYQEVPLMTEPTDK